MNIVFLDAYTTNPEDLSFDILKELGDFEAYDRTSEHQFFERSKNAEILIVNKFLMSEERIKCLNSLKMICVAATGYNNVDVQTAKELGIIVCNVKAYSTKSVAQHVFASLLAVTNRSQQYFDQVQNGSWVKSPDFCFYNDSIRQLDSFKLGIFGFGAIGREVAQIGNAFGMQILACSRSKINDVHVKQVSFEELISQSDILTLHTPLTDETKFCINESTLSKMKDNAIVVNTGRGDLINENDLANHLKSHPNFIAILDVLSTEPPSNGHPLIEIKNCFLTPHIAWASLSARKSLIHGIFKNIQAFLNKAPINVVNS